MADLVQQRFGHGSSLETDGILGDFDDVDLLCLTLVRSPKGESMNRVQAIGEVESVGRGRTSGWRS